jgi:cobalt-zinc-cadmium efflux system outer membrane protein
MRPFLPAYAVSVLLLAACQSLVSDDAAALRAELGARTGSEVPPTPAGADAGVVGDVLALREPLTDEGAVRVALLNNHRVRASYEHLGVARADLVQAGLLRNPVFDGDVRFLFDGGTEMELGLAQPLLDLFYRPLRARLAEHEFAAARALIAAELVDLVHRVRRACVEVRAAERLVALQRAALVAAESAHELALALHAAGNTDDKTLALERAGETRARLDLAAAELAAGEAKEPLQRLLGLWGANTAWSLAGPLADDPLQGLDLTHAETRAVAASLSIAGNRAHADAVAQQIGLHSWQQWFPDGELGVTALREPGGEWGLGPHLALELPLFDDHSAASARGERQLQARLHEHVQLAVEVRSAARTLRQRAAMLADRARFLREVHLPQREAVLRATMQNYNAMQIGVFDVLLQRRQQLADQREYVITLRDAHLARLDLQQLLAGDVPPSAFAAAAPATPTTSDSPARGH